MKGLDRLLDVYRNLRRSTLFLFFIPLASGMEAPKENAHHLAKCTCNPVMNFEIASQCRSASDENSIHFLKFFGYHQVSDDATDKTGDEDYLIFEQKKAKPANNGQFSNQLAECRDLEPVAKFTMKPIVNYTIASVLASEQAIAADGDETAEKLLKILKSASHDKNIPFKSRDMQTIQFQQPVTHSQIVEISCQLILWHKFYSLLIN